MLTIGRLLFRSGHSELFFTLPSGPVNGLHSSRITAVHSWIFKRRKSRASSELRETKQLPRSSYPDKICHLARYSCCEPFSCPPICQARCNTSSFLDTPPDILRSLGTDASAAKALLWHVFEPATIPSPVAKPQQTTSFQAAFGSLRPDKKTEDSGRQKVKGRWGVPLIVASEFPGALLPYCLL
jgi:hypothetical protein